MKKPKWCVSPGGHSAVIRGDGFSVRVTKFDDYWDVCLSTVGDSVFEAVVDAESIDDAKDKALGVLAEQIGDWLKAVNGLAEDAQG